MADAVAHRRARMKPRRPSEQLAALAAVLLSSMAAASRAQEDPAPPPAHYPHVPVAGAQATSFAPPGWKVEAQVSGDVNGDGRPDLVLVLHQQDRANIIAHPDGGEDPLDTNPRILVVAVAGADGRSYRLAVENHLLIPRHDDAFVFDDFDPDPSVHALGASRNAFSVDLRFEANAGSWMTGGRSLTFRLMGGRCSLIGFDDDTRDRRDGSGVRTSVDYLTRRWRVETTATGDATTRTRTGRLPPAALLTISQVGDGMEFEPKLPKRR